MTDESPLRLALNKELKCISHLEHGLAPAFLPSVAVAPITDPNQLRELNGAKRHLLTALDFAGAVATAPASRLSAAPEAGDEMEDGTILAGYYKGKPLYTTPGDAQGVYDSSTAPQYAKLLNAYGHRDWHEPSQGEPNVLWENRNRGKLAGTFNTSGSWPAGRYLFGPSNGSFCGGVQEFQSGVSERSDLGVDSTSLRCVRYQQAREGQKPSGPTGGRGMN